MTIATIRALLVVAVLGCAPSVAAAPQDAVGSGQPEPVVELVLKDGSRMYGSVAHDSATELVFTTLAGAKVTVSRAEIASLRKVSGRVVQGEFVPADPNATRLFFAPTGRSLRRGQTYVGVYEFVMPFVQVGVTDRFSVGGGTPLVFGLDDWERPFWVTPKLQVLDTGRTQLAVGLLHAFDTDGDGGGVAYAVGTRGDDRRAFTAGAGVAYATGGGRAAVVMIGGEAHLRRGLKAITENYVWNGGEGVLSGGIRFVGERLSADLGLAVPIGVGDFFAFPVVNFVYVF